MTEPDHFRVPEGVDVYDVQSPFLFGALHKYEETMRIVAKRPKVRILRLGGVKILDPTASHSLETFCKKCFHDKIDLILSEIHPQPLDVLKRSGLYDSIGPRNVVLNFGQAISRANELIVNRSEL